MDDTARVAGVLERYTEGTRRRDVAILKKIFDPNAVMSHWLGPNRLCGSPQPFFDHLEANAVGDDYASEVSAVVAEGGMATATMREANLFGLSFVNHFHLVKTDDGRWLITAKLFGHS